MTLEQLLNKLIDKGWKPWWLESRMIKSLKMWNRPHCNWVDIDFWEYRDGFWACWKYYSLNDLCSIESWLWQFVCENNLVDSGIEPLFDKYTYYNPKHHEYWLMKSSIAKDKESFLLGDLYLKWIKWVD